MNTAALYLVNQSSLARVNGWGSAGQCPAYRHATTPAAGARVLRVADAERRASARVTLHAATGEGAGR